MMHRSESLETNSGRPDRPYAGVALMLVLTLAVQCGDPHAVWELAQRKLYPGRRGLLTLYEYISQQAQTRRSRERARNNHLVVDSAKDWTFERFTNLPCRDHVVETQQRQITRAEPRSGAGTAGQMGQSKPAARKNHGPNARLYLGAVLDVVERTLKLQGEVGELETEVLIQRVLAIVVRRHLAFSIGDCLRRIDGESTRYTLTLNGRSLTVYMPTSIESRRRRAWLERHVGAIDPSLPGERQRVQDEIDRIAGRPRTVSLSKLDPERVVARPWNATGPVESSLFGEGLVQKLAREKVANRHRLRPAIGSMEPDRLMQLIYRIFEEIENGNYRPGVIAGEWGVDQATFSRFAGKRWMTRDDRLIPDLFRNLASLIARYPHFIEIAAEAGVWRRIREIAGGNSDGRTIESLDWLAILTSTIGPGTKPSQLRAAIQRILEADPVENPAANRRQFLMFMKEVHDYARRIARRLPRVVLRRADEAICTVGFDLQTHEHWVENLVPGLYSVELDNGRVLWAKELERRHLVWREAFGNQPITLAADTGGLIERHLTSFALLCQGQVMLGVWPGLEHGRLKITMIPPWDRGSDAP